MDTWLPLGFVLFCLVLIPFARKLVELRIAILKKLHLDWGVQIMEAHFDGWVMFFRVVLFVIAGILILRAVVA